MSPHKPHPPSRKIEVDLSEILIRPEKLPTKVSHELKPGTALIKSADWSIGPHDTRIGPSGWTNINFVAVSCLIALFCTLFIRDNFEYSRRTAHLKDDVVYPRPELDSMTIGGLSLKPAQLVSGMQLDHSKMPGFNENGADINPSPVLSTLQPTNELQTLGSSPNIGRTGDSASASNSSSAHSDSVARDSVSQATSSRSITSSRGGRSISVRSSTTRLSRHSRQSMISSRARSLSDRQSLRHSLTNRPASKSMPQTARQTVNGLTFGNQNGQSNIARAQMAAVQNIMSMHSLGNGTALRQSQGAMNPMRMESGMLGQPGVGTGLGGINGNGLGGAGGHGGAAHR